MNEHSRTTLSIVALVCALGSCESSAVRPPRVTGAAVGPRSPATYETVGDGGHEIMTWKGNPASVRPSWVSRKFSSTDLREKVLDDRRPDAWLGDREIAHADKHRRDVCRDDGRWGKASPRCKRATNAMSEAVADAIAKGRVSEAGTSGLAEADRNPLR
jgi:hypothetical protein